MTYEVRRVAKKAKFDVEFKDQLVKSDPKAIAMFGLFADKLDKCILAAMYQGYIMGKEGVEAAQNL